MLEVGKFVELLVESLAEKLHEIETERFKTLLNYCIDNGNGSFTIPEGPSQEIIDIISTPYVKLDEEHQLYYRYIAGELADTFTNLVELLTIGGTHIKDTERFFGDIN